MHTWRSQCLAYSPGQHVGDLLMASWFARQAALSADIVTASTLREPLSPARYGETKARYGSGPGRTFGGRGR
jgi:hypothetical protein